MLFSLPFLMIHFEPELSIFSDKLLGAKIFNRDVHKHLKTTLTNPRLVRDRHFCPLLHRFQMQPRGQEGTSHAIKQLFSYFAALFPELKGKTLTLHQFILNFRCAEHQILVKNCQLSIFAVLSKSVPLNCQQQLL